MNATTPTAVAPQPAFDRPLSRRPLPRCVSIAAALLLLTTTALASDSAPGQHLCIHDAILRSDRAARGSTTGAGPLTLPTALTVAQSPQPHRALSDSNTNDDSSDEWRPLRIAVFSEDLSNTDGTRCTVAGQRRPNLLGGTLTCAAADVLAAADRDLLLEVLLPAAIAMHSARLLVRPLSRIVLSPDSDSSGGVCSRFTIPAAHFSPTDGVANADVALYVSAAPIDTSASSGAAAAAYAWALPCQANAASGRPVAAVLNVSPRALASWANSTAAVRVLAHELLHALGFELGAFRQQRLVTTATTAVTDGPDDSVRGKLSATGLTGPAAVAAARAHYGCSTVSLVELGDRSTPATGARAGAAVLPAGSHWKTRNAKDELMAPPGAGGGGSGSMRYTAMTIAAMEDLGYYRGNYASAEPMAWGRQRGCRLIDTKCIVGGSVVAQPANGTVGGEDMFCTEVANFTAPGCTSDRMAIGTCDLSRSPTPFATYAQYFPDRYMGGTLRSMDYCPIVVAPADGSTSCYEPGSGAGKDGTRPARDSTGRQSMPASVMEGSVRSQSARCLSPVANMFGAQLRDRVTLSYNDNGEVVKRPITRTALCVDVQCSPGAGTYQVRFFGANHFVDCPVVGGMVQASESNNALFDGDGVFECPAYDEMCVGNIGTTEGAEVRLPMSDGCRGGSSSSSRGVAVVIAAACITSLFSVL